MTTEKALKTLSGKHDCRVKGRKIFILTGRDKHYPRKNDLGNVSWGAIDYLSKHLNGYSVIYVDSFNNRKRKRR